MLFTLPWHMHITIFSLIYWRVTIYMTQELFEELWKTHGSCKPDNTNKQLYKIISYSSWMASQNMSVVASYFIIILMILFWVISLQATLIAPILIFFFNLLGGCSSSSIPPLPLARRVHSRATLCSSSAVNRKLMTIQTTGVQRRVLTLTRRNHHHVAGQVGSRVI